DHAVVLQDDHVASVLQEGRYVGGDEVLSVTAADHQRAVTAGADDQVRVLDTHHHQGESAVGSLHHLADRLGQREIRQLLDQVGDHLGVRVRREGVPTRQQLRLEGGPVLEDPVV